MFRSLTDNRSPIATLRAFRTADYSVLLQVGGPMYLPARYSSFHVVGIPIGADYAIARSDARARWAGRLSAQDVSIHAAGRGSMVGWPEGASCLYINFRAGFISQHAGSTHAPAVSLETHHTRRDRFIREIGDALLEAMTLGEPDRAGHAIVRTLGR